MAIMGLRHTGNFATNERPENWREGYLRLYPNGMAPLTALTSQMKSKKTDDPKFHWWEKLFPTQRIAINEDLDGSETAITVVDGALQFKVGDILRVEATGEHMRISADPSIDTEIAVTRGVGGTSATALAVGSAGINPYIFKIGSSYAENSNAPSGVNYDPTERDNVTQIFRDTLEMSRTAQQTNLRTGDQVKEAKRECLEIHNVSMEKAFWFGKKQTTTLSSKPIRYTAGIISFIDSGNIVDQAGDPMDMETLEEQLFLMFKFGSNEKMAFLGNRALLTIQQIIRKNSAFNIQSGIKEYGMNVSRLVCPFGELVMKTHPLFNQLASGAVSGTNYYSTDSWMFVLDMKEIEYRYMQDTKYQPKLEDNDLDGMKSGYLTECGLEVHHPLSHYLIKGIAAADVDA